MGASSVKPSFTANRAAQPPNVNFIPVLFAFVNKVRSITRIRTQYNLECFWRSPARNFYESFPRVVVGAKRRHFYHVGKPFKNLKGVLTIPRSRGVHKLDVFSIRSVDGYRW